jgi:hypothetical protein
VRKIIGRKEKRKGIRDKRPNKGKREKGKKAKKR